jgi:cytochrome c-type biogenesis protein
MSQLSPLFAPRPSWARLSASGLVGIVAIVGALVALSWLVWSNTQGKAAMSGTETIRAGQVSDLMATLSRTQVTADGEEIEVLLTTPTFFLVTQRPSEEKLYGADRSIVFVANETIHDGNMPSRFSPILQIDGEERHVPTDVRVLSDAVHHRTSVVVFGDVPVGIVDQGHTMELLLPQAKNGARATLEWFTPIDYPASVEQPSRLTVGLIASLAAGLMAAISPCLIQLTAFYLPTLAGVSAEAVGDAATLARRRRKVLRTAALFVAGFTIPYTAGGALMGAIGEQLANSNLLSPTGPIAIGAGVVMIGMAVLVALRARAPLVCHLPMPSVIRQSRRVALLEPFVSGFAIATGCLACFGGAVFAVLLVYAGLLGSALLGALTLLLFSLGLAIPFMLAALSLSWVIPVATRLQRWTPVVGLVCAVMMLFFGLTMVTGNYHAVSGWLFQHLPL